MAFEDKLDGTKTEVGLNPGRYYAANLDESRILSPKSRNPYPCGFVMHITQDKP